MACVRPTYCHVDFMCVCACKGGVLVRMALALAAFLQC